MKKNKVKFISGKYSGLVAEQIKFCDKEGRLFFKYKFEDKNNNFTLRGLDELLTEQEDYEICDNSAI